ncbi:hypothetical protein BN137_2333 [Cronobacter condimenti 1330]|uniref:Uncharacterized protein n=1 Tax=Cronobacter condimenti 1330 TaxID=1073999 RepID=K8AFD5_9ENTR|nr:hypothetical protein BN137_2333 [Cronobacter condimenti 1330]
MVNKIAFDLLRYIYRYLVAETLNNFVYHSVRHYFSRFSTVKKLFSRRYCFSFETVLLISCMLFSTLYTQFPP